METAQVAQPLTGDKLYQQRARKALPLLVRQAHAGEPITYESLAAELSMPNPRNLNYVLGSIGQALNNLAESWENDVPPIQCLVVNKGSGLPGEGISWFIGSLSEYKKLSKRQRRQIVDAELAKIYGFPKWHQVLDAFSLSPVSQEFGRFVDQASRSRQGGESEAHKALKAYVARHPELLGLPASVGNGTEEYSLPSGDSVDVFFENKAEHVGVEVKPLSSDAIDITRGLYQCVKYQAVIEAVQAAFGIAKDVRTVLVLEGGLPQDLVPLKNILGVEVLANVNVV